MCRYTDRAGRCPSQISGFKPPCSTTLAAIAKILFTHRLPALSQVSWTQGSQWIEAALCTRQGTLHLPSHSYTLSLLQTAAFHFPVWPLRKHFCLPSVYLPCLLLSSEMSSQSFTSRSFCPPSLWLVLGLLPSVLFDIRHHSQSVAPRWRGATGQLLLPALLYAVPSGSTVQCPAKGSGCQPSQYQSHTKKTLTIRLRLSPAFSASENPPDIPCVRFSILPKLGFFFFFSCLSATNLCPQKSGLH